MDFVINVYLLYKIINILFSNNNLHNINYLIYIYLYYNNTLYNMYIETYHHFVLVKLNNSYILLILSLHFLNHLQIENQYFQNVYIYHYIHKEVILILPSLTG